MKFKKLRTTLIIILSVIFAISAFHIIKITYDYKTADKTNTEIQEQFVQMIEPTTESSSEPTGEPSSESTAENKGIQVPVRIDFDALKQENNDIIGWIYCPDTPINYPVVKGKDNNQYLRADLKGKYLVSGTIFADYRNNEVGEDKNYIVYGHNMKNSTMFGTLVKYKDQTYYDSHPILYFLTPDANYIIELCAGAVVNRNSDIYQTMPTENTIAEIVSKSTFTSSAKITHDDEIITLSTCSYEFNNARYIIIGKIIKLS